MLEILQIIHTIMIPFACILLHGTYRLMKVNFLKDPYKSEILNILWLLSFVLVFIYGFALLTIYVSGV
jgi:hypothetical protein